MDREKIGFDFLVDTIGRDYVKAHKDAAIFSHGEEEQGLFCFLGIDLHPETRQLCLSARMDDWDIYASCYVLKDGKVVMDECRLPQKT